jgi:hypothetical protein
MTTRDLQRQGDNKKRVINIWNKMKKEGLNWLIKCQIFVRNRILKDSRLNNHWRKAKQISIKINFLGIIHYRYELNPGWSLWTLQMIFHSLETNSKLINNKTAIGLSDLELILVVVYWVMMTSMETHRSIFMIKWHRIRLIDKKKIITAKNLDLIRIIF